MNQKAVRYVKPEKLKSNVATPSNLLAGVKHLESYSSGHKQQEGSTLFSKQSSRTGTSNDSSSDINDGEHEELHRAEETLQPSVLRQGSTPTLFSITTGFRKVSSQSPRSSMPMESIQGRQRMSTFDPNTIKKLKFIKVDSLKEDDQIEV